MPLPLLDWLFALGVLAHNLEEAIYLPAWSARRLGGRVGVGATAFRVADGLLSAAVVAIAGWASLEGPRGPGAYVIAGLALAMMVNAIVPHLAATALFRAYAPGLATGLAFNMPLGGWLIWRALESHAIEWKVFVYAGPLTALGVAASVPLLLAVGGRMATRLGVTIPPRK